MLKSCAYCGRIHRRKEVCPKKPTRVKRNTKQNQFRNTKAWQRKRDAIKERDMYLCQRCKAVGRFVTHDLEVHHIVPLAEDYELRLEDGNLITLCERCHEAVEDDLEARPALLALIEQASNIPPGGV